ncbi:MAG: protein-L-isoaspartate O-methyltransferase [Pseudomonadota bacterium]
MDIELARQQMVNQQVRSWDVIDPQVLDTMASIPREKFMPEDWKDCAFVDRELPLADQQMTFSPKIEGRFLQALQLTGTDVCLEIGTGCGYLTACMATLAKRVVSLEQSETLASRAEATLQALRIDNVSIIHGLAPGALPDQTFDVVVAGGSVRNNLSTIKKMIAVGGRAVIVVDDGQIMSAQRITRVDEEHWLAESLFETVLPPLVGYGPQPRFQF